MSVFSAATRRGFLRILGAAPAALPLAKVQVASVLTKAEPLAAAAALIPQAIPELAGQSILGRLLSREVRDLKEQFDTEEWWAQQMRTDGIDFDIACIKSTSRAWKVLKMAQRHRERHSLYRRVVKTLWPEQ